MRPEFRPRHAPRLVIMVKAPEAGRVKTRLARDIGTVLATAFFRANLTATIERLAADKRWHTILSIAPDRACASAMLPCRGDRMPQGGGDLGVRLARLVANAPGGPIVIIGADIPAIAPSDIWAAFQTLRGADVLFGPSADGGYWLIGLSCRARTRRIFDNVRWSTAFALADTRANLAGRTIREIRAMDDVDDGDDFERLRHLIGRRVVPRTH